MLLPPHSSSVPWLSRTRTAQVPTTEQHSHLSADHRRHNLPVLPLLCSSPWDAGTSGSTSGGHWGRINRKVLLDSQAILPEPGGGEAEVGAEQEQEVTALCGARGPSRPSRTSEGTVGSRSVRGGFPLGFVF